MLAVPLHAAGRLEELFDSGITPITAVVFMIGDARTGLFKLIGRHCPEVNAAARCCRRLPAIR
jgi:hypothetical protein